MVAGVLCRHRIKDGWQLRTVLYLTAFFTLIALTDQLSVFPWIPVVLVRTVAIAVGVLCVLYVMFLDKKTRGLFIRGAIRTWRGTASAARHACSVQKCLSASRRDSGLSRLSCSAT